MTTNEQLKQAALSIFNAGLKAVDPYAAVRQALDVEGSTVVVHHPNGDNSKYELSRFTRIVVIGAGKASARMAQAVEDVLGDRVTDGLVSVKYGHTAPTQHVELVEAGHPLPDAQGMEAARRIRELLQGLGDDALVLCLISGGGSALLPLPAPGISLDEKQHLTGQLLQAGADIGEINAVRKHISLVKGGQLAQAANPAPVISLILSDVVGDHLDVIASGPTAADTSTFADARTVLQRHGLWEHAPNAIRERLQDGAAGRLPDTPTANDPCLADCTSVIIGSNLLALEACERAGRESGWNVLRLASTIEGETRDVARMHAAIAREVARCGAPVAAPACIVSGGETTVTIRGNGKGGRNQEFALAAALDLAETSEIAVFSAGTDGTDGPTDAAGAIAFADTAQRAAAAGLDARAYLDNNDAYAFFDAIEDLIRTGPTGTNVMDIHLLLVGDCSRRTGLDDRKGVIHGSDD